jgi:hypothetical protein
MEDTVMSIRSNMGTIDRAVRLLVGCTLIYVTLVNSDLIANQVVRYILGTLGAINILSAAVAICPLYTLANINTKRQHSQ